MNKLSKEHLKTINIDIFHKLKHSAAIISSLVFYVMAGFTAASWAGIISFGFMMTPISLAVAASIVLAALTLATFVPLLLVLDCYIDSNLNYKFLSYCAVLPALIASVLTYIVGFFGGAALLSRTFNNNEERAKNSLLCKFFSKKYRKNVRLLEQFPEHQRTGVDVLHSKAPNTNTILESKEIKTNPIVRQFEQFASVSHAEKSISYSKSLKHLGR